jgi:PTS system nitrogen regulatory IIA component
MNLKMRDIVELLQTKEKTIHKWIKENKLPAYKINNQYFFNKTEVKEWVLKNNIPVSEKMLALDVSEKPVSFLELLGRGGIFFNIEGDTVIDVIKNSANIIPIPPDVTKEKMMFSLIEREEMMPTAIGRGIAIPHPRNPIIADISSESISICFLNKKINFNAIDKVPVHTIFIVLSAKPTRHLSILSKISFLCQKNEFTELLKLKADKEKILKYVENMEKEWNRQAGGSE